MSLESDLTCTTPPRASASPAARRARPGWPRTPPPPRCGAPWAPFGRAQATAPPQQTRGQSVPSDGESARPWVGAWMDEKEAKEGEGRGECQDQEAQHTALHALNENEIILHDAIQNPYVRT